MESCRFLVVPNQSTINGAARGGRARLAKAQGGRRENRGRLFIVSLLGRGGNALLVLSYLQAYSGGTARLRGGRSRDAAGGSGEERGGKRLEAAECELGRGCSARHRA